MAPMLTLLEQLKQLTITDADGRERTAEWKVGASQEQMDCLESLLGVALPHDFKQFLSHSDGGFIFGLDLMGSMGIRANAQLIPFHNWGNGDFDCLSPKGDKFEVVFMNHSADVTVRIADSFTDWLTRVTQELSRTGCLLHPGDYRHRRGSGV